MLGPVYHLSRVSPGDAVTDPRIHAMSVAGPWASCAYNDGSLVFWSDPDPKKRRPPNLREYEEPRATGHEGLLYYRPKQLPEQSDLALPRSNDMDCDVRLSSGVYLTVPCCLAAPRKLSLSTGQLGDYADEFGKLGYEIFDRISSKEPIALLDPDVLRLVYLGLASRYRLTPELLDDLEWVSVDDIDMLITYFLGYQIGPKSESAEAV